MKPFSVSCTTCRARLKVLDPAAIGQILACPKCHSMVQIDPPPDWSPDDSSPHEGTATASTFTADVATAVLPVAHALEVPAAVVLAASTPIAVASPLAVSRVAPPQSAATPITVAAPIRPVPKPTRTAAPSGPPPAVHAATAARVLAAFKRFKASSWFWPAIGGTAFFVAAAGALVVLKDRHNGARPEAIRSELVSQPTALVNIAAATTPPSVNAPPVQTTQPAIVVDKKVAPALPSPQKSSPPLTVSRVAPPKPDVIAAAPATAPPAEAQPASPPALAPKQTPPQPIPPQPAPQLTAPPAIAANPAPALPIVPHAAAGPTLERIPPRAIDVNARLADRLPGINFQQTPLAVFLAELSQLTTVPISLDADALAELNLSADEPISAQVKNTSLAGVLDESLPPHGLAWRIVGQQVAVGRPAEQGLRQVRYSVADLAATPEARRQFALMVHALVEPNGWSEAEGTATSEWSDGALLVSASSSAHAQLLVLCEKLRLARGLPLRSRFPAERFHLDSRTAHAKVVLAAPITVNFAQPQSLRRIASYLQGAAHVTLLVDQAALAADGISAESEAILSSQQQPFAQAMTALLDSLELTYRVVDDRTLEITTLKAAARHAEIEFYPAGGLVEPAGDGAALVAHVFREVNSAEQGPAAHDAPSPPALQFDAPSVYLIGRAPQSVQRKIESLLASWRPAK